MPLGPPKGKPLGRTRQLAESMHIDVFHHILCKSDSAMFGNEWGWTEGRPVNRWYLEMKKEETYRCQNQRILNHLMEQVIANDFEQSVFQRGRLCYFRATGLHSYLLTLVSPHCCSTASMMTFFLFKLLLLSWRYAMFIDGWSFNNMGFQSST